MATATKEKKASKQAPASETFLLAEEQNSLPVIATFRLIGTTPLLQNNPECMLSGADDEVKLTTKKKYIDKDEVEMRLYPLGDGTYGHPAESVKKTLLAACTGKKFGKISAPGIIRGGVFPIDDKMVICDESGNPRMDYEMDKRPVVNPSNKARIMRCRPKWSNWSMVVRLEIERIVDPQLITQALNLAGRTKGIGDFRPEKCGSFGRFKAELVDIAD